MAPLKISTLFGPRREKTCLWKFANNKGAYQPAYPCSLISVFVISLLESIISRLATSEILIFYLVTVAEETGLCVTLSETLKTGYLVTRPIFTTLHQIPATKIDEKLRQELVLD